MPFPKAPPFGRAFLLHTGSSHGRFRDHTIALGILSPPELADSFGRVIHAARPLGTIADGTAVAVQTAKAAAVRIRRLLEGKSWFFNSCASRTKWKGRWNIHTACGITLARSNFFAWHCPTAGLGPRGLREKKDGAERHFSHTGIATSFKPTMAVRHKHGTSHDGTAALNSYSLGLICILLIHSLINLAARTSTRLWASGGIFTVGTTLVRR